MFITAGDRQKLLLVDVACNVLYSLTRRGNIVATVFSMTFRKPFNQSKGSKASKGGSSRKPTTVTSTFWRYCGLCIIACLLITIACMSYMVVHNHYSADGLYSIEDLTRNFVTAHISASPLSESLRSYNPVDASRRFDSRDANEKGVQTKSDPNGGKVQSIAVISTSTSKRKKQLRVQPTPSPTLDPQRTFFGFPAEQTRRRYALVCAIYSNLAN